MRTKTVFAYYKKRGLKRADIARLLDISRAAVSKWGDIVPEGTAYKLESLTGGELKVESKLYATDKHKVGDSGARTPMG